jgi:hypothetical protein
MKHLRILLGTTIFVLGIVGVISTMGSNNLWQIQELSILLGFVFSGLQHVVAKGAN